jgi:uncharacterized repeat protein (TIGR01451 family)
VTIDPAPVLAVSKSHTDTFTQGQTATWKIQVVNNAASASGATDGSTVTVSDVLPSGYTLNNYSGTGWSCSGTTTVTCTSTAVVAGAGGDFNLLSLLVNIPANSPTSVSNTAQVYGGGDLIHTSLGSAASGSDTNVTVVQTPASITINSGVTPQSAPIGTAFAVPLAVTVKDAGSAVIANYSVVFTAVAGGSGQSGTFSNSTNTITVSTNGSGVATAGTFTANGTAGSYTVDVAAGPAPHGTINLANGQVTPIITWSNPADIVFGSALSGVQLNATASVPGTFVYTPPLGTVLAVGSGQTLAVQFTPTDTTDYANASKNVLINVTSASGPATLVITRTLTRESGTNDVLVTLTLANTGGSAATSVQLTSGKIGSANTTTSLPASIPDIAAGGSQSITVRFAAGSVGSAGSAAVLSYAGTYTGGTFGGSSRITLP